MAANIIGRYVWLVDTLRRYKRLTFKEINELWQESGLGYGDVFPKRTFHNHQKAIVDLFDVYIECDRKDGYRYYLDEPENVYRVYALDRISHIEETNKTFTINKDFDAQTYFEGCCGVITSDKPAERVVIRAYGGFADYLRTLPLHESQRELGGDDESTLFEYRLKLTFDFYQQVLEQGDQMEVLEPEEARKELHNFALNLMRYYDRKEDPHARTELHRH